VFWILVTDQINDGRWTGTGLKGSKRRLRSFDKNWKTGRRTRAVCLTSVILAVGMTIMLRSLADSPAKAGDVTDPRVRSEAADGKNWLLNGHSFEAQHFSPLKQITIRTPVVLGWPGPWTIRR
jgi:hypothetical protein